MRRITQHEEEKQIFIWLLTAAILVCCAFISPDIPQQSSQDAIPSLSFTTSRGMFYEYNSLLQKQNLSVSESFFPEKTDGFSILKHSREFSTVLFCAIAALSCYIGSVSACQFFCRSDCTPRYSIVSYLHRSDGKKPAWMYRCTYHSNTMVGSKVSNHNAYGLFRAV